MKKHVKCGDLLMGLSSLSSDGKRKWFDFPRYRVVGLHMDGEHFFVEWLNEDGSTVRNVSYTYFHIGSSQYRLWEDNEG